jgi:formyltetrahydrofolate hydrolase
MLVAAGHDSERRALTAAVRYALEHLVSLYGARSIVFK